jgi:hypothetical protein
MKRIPHRVDSVRAPVIPPPPLTKDAWVGETFVEASGDQLVSTWNGHDSLPGLNEWPLGMSQRSRSLVRTRGKK